MRHPLAATLLRISLPALAATTVGAQAVPSWRLVETWRLAPEDADLSRVATVLLDARGTIVLTQPDDFTIRFFPRTGPGTSFGRGGEGPGEFRNGHMAGLRGDTVWVSDPTLRRVTFIDRAGKLAGTMPYPTDIEGTGTPAGSIPLAFPQGILADGSVLFIGFFARTARPAWAADDAQGSPLFVADRSGRYRHLTGWTAPNSACSRTFSMSGGTGVVQVPFCTRSQHAVSANGDRVVFIAPDAGGGAARAFRVMALATNGDTLFNRRVPFTAVAVAKRVADSVRQMAIDRVPAGEAARLGLTNTVGYPTTYPPYRRVVLGNDHSTWIEVRTAAERFQWLVLGPDGNARATATLPAAMELRAASASEAVASYTDDDGLTGLVRFRIERGGR